MSLPCLMDQQQPLVCVACVCGCLVFLFSWLSYFDLWLFSVSFSERMMSLTPVCFTSDLTVQRISGSTFSIRENMREWRCTTAPNVAMPQILQWSSATIWRRVTLTSRTQTLPTYTQVLCPSFAYVQQEYQVLSFSGQRSPLIWQLTWG